MRNPLDDLEERLGEAGWELHGTDRSPDGAINQVFRANQPNESGVREERTMAGTSLEDAIQKFLASLEGEEQERRDPR